MGDPKKLKKKYNTPAHPWNRITIDEERVLVQEYGLQKKKEIQIANSFLKKYKDITKRLIADTTAQGAKERQQMLDKLQRLGLLRGEAKLDQVLSITLKDILERRIQSIVCRKGLSKGMWQARQFITHRHIAIGDKEITSPSYLVSLSEEGIIAFKATSPFAHGDHPELLTAAAKKKERPVQPERRDQRRGGRKPVKMMRGRKPEKKA